jgi:hypothetical protein
MKAVLTFVVVLFATSLSLAQNTKSNAKVVPLQMDVVLVTGLGNVEDAPEVQLDSESTLVRLYRRPHTRVKKELSFTTKENSPKLA